MNLKVPAAFREREYVADLLRRYWATLPEGTPAYTGAREADAQDRTTHLGLDEAVDHLESRGNALVLAAQVDNASWVFAVWMSPDGRSVIACAGVEHPTRA
ncbi:hypothetical protein [Streptomyces sp. NBC_00401]|uniref:hypothetical protein n=1 Tax=Streptomyces sp. NBC_00401 TaxID=2975738 RepID=UPI00225AB650|nr:hypothetical protein [Streptomyces sp. NBC_00401]MCX5086914.1 hypothetical protein [Streptomyces sp. NBC_00401]